MTYLSPKEGWDYVGCLVCGFVDTVPSLRVQDGETVACCHTHQAFFWGDPLPEGWSRMVAVDVLVRPQMGPEAAAYLRKALENWKRPEVQEAESRLPSRF